MERPQDFEEREEPAAGVDAGAAETAGDTDADPQRDDRHAGTDVPQAVADAEDQPDI